MKKINLIGAFSSLLVLSVLLVTGLQAAEEPCERLPGQCTGECYTWADQPFCKCWQECNIGCRGDEATWESTCYCIYANGMKFTDHEARVECLAVMHDCIAEEPPFPPPTPIPTPTPEDCDFICDNEDDADSCVACKSCPYDFTGLSDRLVRDLLSDWRQKCDYKYLFPGEDPPMWPTGVN
jgi:hypothetical protein